jgi:hypothetical protein
MPPGLSTLDARFFYRADDALAFLTELGPRGRTEYFVHECIDVGFIAIYTLLLRALAERWHFQKGAVGLLVFAPGAADFLETTGILVMLFIYPLAPHALAATIGYCTLLKWTAGIVLMIAMQIDRRRR